MPGFILNGKIFQTTYSALADYSRCPRLYFYRNIFRTDSTGKIIEILSPELTLGNIVHNTIDEFTKLAPDERNGKALREIFYKFWPDEFGNKGGFKDSSQELFYKDRAKEMLNRFYKNKEYSEKTPIRLPTSPTPKIELNKENNILLSGKTDWIEELPDKTLYVLDFKTGTKKEMGGSLQLPVYAFYVSKVRGQEVSQVGYWYLQLEDKPSIWETKDLQIEEKIKAAENTALTILQSTKDNTFECPEEECRWCRPFEDVLNGKAKLVETTWNKEKYLFV